MLETQAPVAAQMFANAATDYMERYRATAEDFAQVVLVNHVHSQYNPYSQFRNALYGGSDSELADDSKPTDEVAMLSYQRRRGGSCHSVSSIPQPTTSPQISGHPYPRTMRHD
jgi:acetyl-CoA acetyltransferase